VLAGQEIGIEKYVIVSTENSVSSTSVLEFHNPADAKQKIEAAGGSVESRKGDGRAQPGREFGMKRSAWRFLWIAPDIRNRLLISVALLAIYRLAAHVPVRKEIVMIVSRIYGLTRRWRIFRALR
jgi:hypothetical protein